MKCRTHTSDQSAGVCPFCLRERLSALAAATSRSDFSDLCDDVKNRRSDFSDSIVLKPWISNMGFLALITGLRKKNKKKSQQISLVNGRGMSPAMYGESEEYGCCIATPSRRKVQRQQNPSRLSSYAICLSPMLRPSSGNRRRSYAPPETLFSDDLKRALNRKWSGVGRVAPDGASALGLNRSRKLVDLGKAW